MYSDISLAIDSFSGKIHSTVKQRWLQGEDRGKSRGEREREREREMATR